MNTFAQTNPLACRRRWIRHKSNASVSIEPHTGGSSWIAVVICYREPDVVVSVVGRAVVIAQRAIACDIDMHRHAVSHTYHTHNMSTTYAMSNRRLCNHRHKRKRALSRLPRNHKRNQFRPRHGQDP
jgi:precorrin isomerase